MWKCKSKEYTVGKARTTLPVSALIVLLLICSSHKVSPNFHTGCDSCCDGFIALIHSLSEKQKETNKQKSPLKAMSRARCSCAWKWIFGKTEFKPLRGKLHKSSRFSSKSTYRCRIGHGQIYSSFFSLQHLAFPFSVHADITACVTGECDSVVEAFWNKNNPFGLHLHSPYSCPCLVYTCTVFSTHWWRKDCVRKLAAEERSELVCKAHCRSRKEPWLSTAPSMPAGHPLPLECCQLARGDCEGLMKDSTNSYCDSQLPLTVAAAFLHFCSSPSIFSSKPSVLIHFNRSWMAECLFLTAFATGL